MKQANTTKFQLFFLIGCFTFYLSVFGLNSALFNPDVYDWPNLTKSSVDFDHPESEYEERIAIGLETYLNNTFKYYKPDLGMVVSGGMNGDGLYDGSTRTQVRIALSCLALSYKNDSYREIGNNLLRTSYLQFQEHIPSAGVREWGNSYWYLLDGEVEDLNAGPFNSIILGYIFYFFYDQLDNDVVAMWNDGMREIISVCVHRLDEPSYTNIHLLRTAGLLVLSRYFGDHLGINLAMQFFREWRDYTLNMGLREYATINYLQVSLRAIMAIWEFAPTQQFSDEVSNMIDFLWGTYLIQENNGNMGGPHARDYADDFYFGGGMRPYINHYFGGFYPPPNNNPYADPYTMASHFTEYICLVNWVPSEFLKEIVNNRTYPYLVHYSYGDIVTSTYYTKNYSLGGQSGVDPKGETSTQTIPIYATLNTSVNGIEVGNERNSIFFKDFHAYRNLRANSISMNNSLAGSFQIESKGLDVSEEIGVLGCLGNTTAVTDIYINSTHYTSDLHDINIELGTNTTLCYRIGDVYIGIRVIFGNEVADIDEINDNPAQTPYLRIFSYDEISDSDFDWDDARNDEFMLYINGVYTYSSFIIQMNHKSDWAGFPLFAANFYENTSLSDLRLGETRTLNGTQVDASNETFSNIAFKLEYDMNNFKVTEKSIDLMPIDEDWVYNSPWLQIPRQNINYQTNFFLNTEYFPYFLFVLLTTVSFALIIGIKKAKVRGFGTGMDSVEDSQESVSNESIDNNAKFSNIILFSTITIILVDMIFSIFGLYSYYILNILQIIKITIGIGAIEMVKRHNSRGTGFDLFIQVFLGNLIVFIILTIIFTSYSWTFIILYCIFYLTLGLWLMMRLHPLVSFIDLKFSGVMFINKITKFLVFLGCIGCLLYGVLLLVKSTYIGYLLITINSLGMIVSTLLLVKFKKAIK